MRTTQFFIAAAALALAGCAAPIRVRTAVSPDANLGSGRTFRVLPAPKQRTPSAQSSTNDPMLVNSMSNRALRTDLAQGFEGKGYVVNDSNPDFAVAYYASTRQRLDVSAWDYGYLWRPRWSVVPMVTQYTQGTLIVDVIDPKSQEILWRGQGVAAVSDDEQRYERELQKTVAAILAKFPAAAPLPGISRRT
jgi:hypothetical protein